MAGSDIVAVTNLQGHGNGITGIAIPEGGNKRIDGTVRIWDCDGGAGADALITHGPWVFCGAGGVVKAWNVQTNAEFTLQFHNQMLFAGTDTGIIFVWKSKPNGNGPFELVASLTGHTAAVVCLRMGFNKLYSGSVDHSIKVFDVQTLQCVATLSGHSDVVTSLECSQQFLISCSLDCTVKVWHMTETGNFNLEVAYTHYVEHGIVALFRMFDAEIKLVLFCSCSDSSLRLYDLPSFDERAVFYGKD